MIKIKELTPKKIPGLSSLFVTFDYCKEIVAVIKTCTPAYFDKKTSVWEIPTTRLAKFINGVNQFDDIEFYPQRKKQQEDKVFKLSNYKTTPYD